MQHLKKSGALLGLFGWVLCWIVRKQLNEDPEDRLWESQSCWLWSHKVSFFHPNRPRQCHCNSSVKTVFFFIRWGVRWNQFSLDSELFSCRWLCFWNLSDKITARYRAQRTTTCRYICHIHIAGEPLLCVCPFERWWHKRSYHGWISSKVTVHEKSNVPNTTLFTLVYVYGAWKEGNENIACCGNKASMILAGCVCFSS